MFRNLTIGCPAYDSFKAQTVICLVRMTGTLKVPYRFEVAKGSFIHGGREALLDLAVEIGSSHLLFVDTDMVFPPDVVDRLAAHKKAIVGVAANQKRLPLETNVVPLGGKAGGEIPKELFECESVGTGVMLIDLRKVKDLPRPCFDLSRRDGHVVGEDVWFCEHARAHGLKVFCDPTIPVGHVGDRIY